MALLTTLQKLESVQTAITAIEEGSQAYSRSGRSLTRADLAALYVREERLLRQYNAETGKSGRNYAKPESVT